MGLIGKTSRTRRAPGVNERELTARTDRQRRRQYGMLLSPLRSLAPSPERHFEVAVTVLAKSRSANP